ncbi:MAG: hypothetical protein H6817_01265 [Phycisphaerales bacterium]|nr:hypothetical protein [Phycisphaerales bacterium]
MNATYDDCRASLVELRKITVGRWSASSPQANVFAGSFAPGGNFARIDVELAGLHNPPGDTDPLNFHPFTYGPYPVYGFIEFDLDEDNETGGETYAPEFRYLSNIARFGGLPDDHVFEDRLAIDGDAYDEDFTTPPYIERSGEEFHLALLGGQFEHAGVEVVAGDGDNLFESGETWDITGKWFHRAHGFEPYSLASGGSVPGEYMPDCQLRFSHDVGYDTTTVSLVFPLTNVAAAAMNGEMPQPNNHDPSDQASITEALKDLAESAEVVEMFPTGQPEEELILGWRGHGPGSYLKPDEWRVTALVGIPYSEPGYGFVWTDAWPDPMRGDVDGKDEAEDDDIDAIEKYIDDHDGDDGLVDDRVVLAQFAANFTVYDVNQDGVVDNLDKLLVSREGDGTADDDIDLEDFAKFQRCNGWSTGWGDWCGIFDLNGDGTVDTTDFNWLSNTCTGPVKP